MNGDHREMTIGVISISDQRTNEEENALLATRRRSKEIRRPSVTLTRDLSTASTGIENVSLALTTAISPYSVFHFACYVIAPAKCTYRYSSSSEDFFQQARTPKLDFVNKLTFRTLVGIL